MARKYDLISELYNRTCKTVVSNPQNWQAFLASACRNYKLRYDEQLLVYAQRPDATAVLEIEQWNKIFGRWVNRGARGIAVFADENRSRQRLTHYFDISDTHESRYSRTVPIWDMRQEYEADVIETLESTFGEIENKSSLAEAIMGAARNAAEDNIPDYLQDLYYATEGSSFEEVEEDIVAFIYKNVVANSVAYMMMSRLGIDTDGYFELDDFRDVTNFNTQETLNALGFATSDIAEMGLTEVSKTITALNRQNRIIVGQDRNEYNKVENNDERSLDNERTDLHDGGRLQPSEPETSTAAGSDFGQIRSDEERVSEGTSQSPLLQSPDEGRTDTALGGSGTESQQDGGNNPEPDGTERGSDRTDESGGYDEMGSSDELPSQLGTGNRESGSDIRLEYYDRTHEDKSLPFFGRDEVINEILRTTPHLSASLEEIKDYYERNPDNKDRTEYIKSIFNNDYTELTLEDGRTVGYKTFENVLHLWEGKYDSRTAQSFYDWAVIARHFEAMRLLGELSDSIKPLPSMDGQMTFILDGRAEEKKTSAFTFSQEIIDAVLANGSGFSEGKMRIYEQFEKSLSAKENADFLKNEYGWGGSYPVIIGAGIDESHDGKGITITKGIGKEKPHITLSWSQVEKRIGELIRMDRYLNPKEKEHYPQWLESQEERRAKIEETKRNREILSNAPPEQEVEPTEKEPEEAEQLQDVQYEYHLGDKVYIGASEYEILSVDDERVMLYDYDMPLFNKEFSRTEFDRKVRENPINEHLIVKEEPAEERNDKEPEPVVPAWEQKKKVKGFDLHPDVPMADRHTFNLRENEVETVGKKERFRRNIMAIQLLKKCQEENRFLDLISMEKSHCYNPFVYLQNDNDVQKLVTNLFKSTTPKGSQAQDPFWDTSASMLLLALVFYLHYEAPEDEQNFAMIMEMLRAGAIEDEEDTRPSPLDELFAELEMSNPDHIALKYYRSYHSGAAKTLKSIQITLAARLEKFNLESLASLTTTDELDLPSLGEQKVALFALIPDNDSSFNFLVSILYTQLFQQLFYAADHIHGGSLPVPVHFLMDEFANVSLPDDFDKILSVMW